MQRLALRELSRACLENGPHIPEVSSALADGLATLIGGGCIIRGPTDCPPSAPLACAHTRASSLETLRSLFQVNPHALAFGCSAQVVRSGQPILLPLVTSKVLRLWTQPAAWDYLERHPISTLLVAPVLAARRACATIVVWREPVCQPLTPSHTVLLREVAQRLSVTL